jgi:hypothetical protein
MHQIECNICLVTNNVLGQCVHSLHIYFNLVSFSSLLSSNSYLSPAYVRPPLWVSSGEKWFALQTKYWRIKVSLVPTRTRSSVTSGDLLCGLWTAKGFSLVFISAQECGEWGRSWSWQLFHHSKNRLLEKAEKQSIERSIGWDSYE